MEFYENFARGYLTEREVIVRNSQVFSSTCLDNGKCKECGENKCPAFVYSKVNTISDLFASAEWEIKRPECIRSMLFDEAFGFPKHIEVHCPMTRDDEHSVRVTSFKLLDK